MTSVSPVEHTRVPLERPRVSLVTGVAEGLAQHLGWKLLAVRIAFVVLTLVGGAGAMFYVWLWILMPRAQQPEELPRTRTAPVAWILAAGAAIATIVAVLVLTASPSTLLGGLPISVIWVLWSLVAQVLCIVAGLWAGFIDVRDPARGPQHALAVRATVTVLLLVLIGLYGYDFVVRGTSVLSFLAALMAVVALGAVYSPLLVRTLRDATTERIRRIREEQRSEMAAHLHDSVLQTLALIQNRAGASSEAARLARAQERELRSWLYDGDEPADSDLPTDLRDYAAALELDYPVVFDVVAAGASTERASGEVAAAAREAMLNAARHAPGPISVYIEGSQRAVDVFIRDRGEGFDLEAVPSDRLGVRQSIVGRMRRAGGDARVVRRDNGTEIHLTLDYARAAAKDRSQEVS